MRGALYRKMQRARQEATTGTVSNGAGGRSKRGPWPECMALGPLCAACPWYRLRAGTVSERYAGKCNVGGAHKRIVLPVHVAPGSLCDRPWRRVHWCEYYRCGRYRPRTTGKLMQTKTNECNAGRCNAARYAGKCKCSARGWYSTPPPRCHWYWRRGWYTGGSAQAADCGLARANKKKFKRILESGGYKVG